MVVWQDMQKSYSLKRGSYAPHFRAEFLLVLLACPSFAQTPSNPFVAAPHGCSMAHCNNRMNDLMSMGAPTTSSVAIINHDVLSPGKGIGLGCASNGALAACTYKDPSGDNLVFYDAAGNRLWASGSLLDDTAWASAPMISSNGDVIAADDTRVVRLTSAGVVKWNTLTPGGTPISPVTTEAGIVVLATDGGPVSAFDSRTGNLVGAAYLQYGLYPAHFDTVNTPCVRGNRIYISGRIENDPDNHGALFAVDVDPTNPTTPLSVAWAYPFGAPSGASPLCVGNTIYFDGASVSAGQPQNPQIFAIQDGGDSPTLLWNVTVPNLLPANIAQDPRGGVWALFDHTSMVERFDTTTGVVMDGINVSKLVGDPDTNYPYSAIMMAGTATDPIMLLGSTSTDGKATYVLAVDLPSHSLLWKVNIAPSQGNDSAPSQFALMAGTDGKPVVVFAGCSSGAYFVAEP